MGLLRRNPPPSQSPPGDWLDALQVAMRVDPALRPKRDRPAAVQASPDLPPRPPAEVPRRFRPPEPLRPVADVDFAPVELADALPLRPSVAGKPWLPRLAPPPPPVLPPSVVAATPPAAVEPLFQWACRLSRMRRADAAAFDTDALRAEAERLLAPVVADRLRAPLASFVDVVMTRGGLPLAGPWRPLGPVPPDRAYAAAAAEAAADPTGQHDGTWAVHHAALSLIADLVPDGTAVLDDLDAKLHGVAPPEDRICPGAYEGVFDHAIVRPVGRPLRAVAAAAVGLLLLAVAGAVLLNLRYVGQLRGSVDTVDRALRTSR